MAQNMRCVTVTTLPMCVLRLEVSPMGMVTYGDTSFLSPLSRVCCVAYTHRARAVVSHPFRDLSPSAPPFLVTHLGRTVAVIGFGLATRRSLAVRA
jgi:hypothetical protein